MRHFWGDFTLPVSCWSCWAAHCQPQGKEFSTGAHVLLTTPSSDFSTPFPPSESYKEYPGPLKSDNIYATLPLGPATAAPWGMLTNLFRSLSQDTLKWRDKNPGERLEVIHTDTLDCTWISKDLFSIFKHTTWSFSFPNISFSSSNYNLKPAGKRLSRAKEHDPV